MLRDLERIKKAPLIKTPAKASIWYIASSALQRSIGVVGTPIFTRLLTPEEYGLYPLYNTWLAIITVIVTLEITGGIALRGIQKFYDRRSDYIAASVGLIGVVFIIVSILYFSFSNYVNKITGLTTFITSVMLVQIFANSIINLYSQLCKYSYRYKSVALINITSSLGIPFIAVMFTVTTRLRAESRILGSAIITLLIAVPVLIALLKRSLNVFDIKIWRFLLKSSVPLLPHYLSLAVILRVGEITVGRVHGREALGRYSVAISLGMSLTMITGGLISAVSPWMLRRIKAAEIGRIRDLLLLLTRGLCLLCLLILAVVPETVKIITPPDYHSCLPAVYPLALSAIPMFLSNAVLQGEMYYERNAVSSLPSLAAAGVSSLLSFAVLPFIDYRYVSVFVLLSYITLLALNILIFKRLSGEYPISFKPTAVTYMLCTAYAGLLCLFRESVISRIILAVPLLPMALAVGIKVYEVIREREKIPHREEKA